MRTKDLSRLLIELKQRAGEGRISSCFFSKCRVFIAQNLGKQSGQGNCERPFQNFGDV